MVSPSSAFLLLPVFLLVGIAAVAVDVGACIDVVGCFVAVDQIDIAIVDNNDDVVGLLDVMNGAVGNGGGVDVVFDVMLPMINNSSDQNRRKDTKF